MTYLIIGMHKSGTTLIAESLLRSGLNLGYDMDAGSVSYSASKGESPALRALNAMLLGSNKSQSSLSLQPRDTGSLNRETLRCMSDFLERQAAYADWALKDPRLALTYEYWKPMLPPHKLILVVRDPVAVAMHYIRDWPVKGRALFPFVVAKAFRVWTAYNQRILSLLRDSPKQQTLLLSYESMMSSGTYLQALGHFVGRPIPDCRTQRYQKRGMWLDRIICRYAFLMSQKVQRLHQELISWSAVD